MDVTVPELLPVMVIGELPRILKPEQDTEPEHEAVVVGTLVIWLLLVTSAKLPFAHGEVVERPLNAIVPEVVNVPPVMGHVVATEVTVPLFCVRQVPLIA